ncbi:MAG: hypothetical protein QM755_23045 [Luteolibacter sp.]
MPRLLGNKVTVVEGSLGEHGSDGPIKLRLSDGTEISAQRLTVAKEGVLVMEAPWTRIGPSNPGALMNEGSAILHPDGSITGDNGVMWMETDSDFDERLMKPM